MLSISPWWRGSSVGIDAKGANGSGSPSSSVSFSGGGSSSSLAFLKPLNSKGASCRVQSYALFMHYNALFMHYLSHNALLMVVCELEHALIMHK
jgi:hypothetical protein